MEQDSRHQELSTVECLLSTVTLRMDNFKAQMWTPKQVHKIPKLQAARLEKIKQAKIFLNTVGFSIL